VLPISVEREKGGTGKTQGKKKRAYLLVCDYQEKKASCPNGSLILLSKKLKKGKGVDNYV